MMIVQSCNYALHVPGQSVGFSYTHSQSPYCNLTQICLIYQWNMGLTNIFSALITQVFMAAIHDKNS